MEEVVRARLLQLSADFYKHHAESFHETRRGEWTTWTRVMNEIRARITPATVLDLGCGNGRFASFLDQQDPPMALDYVGIDSESQLVAKAQSEHADKRFRVETVDQVLAADTKFDLVVAFGLFHHLPGNDYRAAVLQKIADRLGPNGVACISLWQPSLLPNFQTKAFPTPPSGLEPGDHLLGWNGDFDYLRYCHDFTDHDIAALTRAIALPLVSEFQGTGNDASNRYLLFQNVS